MWCKGIPNRGKRFVHGHAVRVRNPIIDGHKKCNRCKKMLELAQFTKDQTKTSGYSSHCKECKKITISNWRKENPTYDLEWKSAHPEVSRRACKKYYAKHKDVRSNGAHKRRLIIAAENSDFIERQVVFDRDQGICYLCNKEVNPNDWWLEHKIPLSRGGSHTYDNVAVSHPGCNARKQAKFIEELSWVNGSSLGGDA